MKPQLKVIIHLETTPQTDLDAFEIALGSMRPGEPGHHQRLKEICAQHRVELHYMEIDRVRDERLRVILQYAAYAPTTKLVGTTDGRGLLTDSRWAIVLSDAQIEDLVRADMYRSWVPVAPPSVNGRLISLTKLGRTPLETLREQGINTQITHRDEVEGALPVSGYQLRLGDVYFATDVIDTLILAGGVSGVVDSRQKRIAALGPAGDLVGYGNGIDKGQN